MHARTLFLLCVGLASFAGAPLSVFAQNHSRGLDVEFRLGQSLVGNRGIRDDGTGEFQYASHWLESPRGTLAWAAQLSMRASPKVHPFVSYSERRFQEELSPHTIAEIYQVHYQPELVSFAHNRAKYQVRSASAGLLYYPWPARHRIRPFFSPAITLNEFSGQSQIRASGHEEQGQPEVSIEGHSLLETRRALGWTVGWGVGLTFRGVELRPVLQYVAASVPVHSRKFTKTVLDPAVHGFQLSGDLTVPPKQKIVMRHFELNIGLSLRLF